MKRGAREIWLVDDHDAKLENMAPDKVEVIYGVYCPCPCDKSPDCPIVQATEVGDPKTIRIEARRIRFETIGAMQTRITGKSDLDLRSLARTLLPKWKYKKEIF